MVNSEETLILPKKESSSTPEEIAYRNAHQALQFVDKESKQRTLTEETIKNIHSICMTELLPDDLVGSYRRSNVGNVGVGRGGVTPPDYSNVPWLMEEFIDDANKKLDDCSLGLDCLPTVIETMAFSHYVFTRIHPFDDGNGRTVRLLTDLIAKKYHLKPIIVWPQEKGDYIKTLEAVDRSGNLAHLEIFLIRHLLQRYQGGKGHNAEVYRQLERLGKRKSLEIEGQAGQRTSGQIWKTLEHPAFD